MRIDKVDGLVMLAAISITATAAFVMVSGSQAREARDQRNADWLVKMQEANCKRTSYVGATPRAVWTCPDGQAYIDPR